MAPAADGLTGSLLAAHGTSVHQPASAAAVPAQDAVPASPTPTPVVAPRPRPRTRPDGGARSQHTARPATAVATPAAARAEAPLHLESRTALLDRRSPAFDTLQDPARALSGLPRDRAGVVNWVKALRDGLIAPRARIDRAGAMTVRDDDIVMTNTRNMPHVRFPHAAHTEWLSCGACHPRPFEQRRGAHHITMDAMYRGHYCGKCHDRVAFSTFVCERCHSIPHAGSPPRWW